MNGQHLRALSIEELAPKAGEALVAGGVCKDAGGEVATGAAALLQGSLELVADVVGQAQEVLGYDVSAAYEFVLGSIASAYCCMSTPDVARVQRQGWF